MNPSFNNYSDFLAWILDPETPYQINFAVTYQYVDYSRHITGPILSEILQFEKSNAKWYKPEPFEGRKEIGYGWSLWFNEKQDNYKIQHVRPV